MSKKVLLALLFFCFAFSKAQTLKLSGNITDTATKQSLPNALMMAIKFTDSTLINYSRTDVNGLLKPIKIPTDTYIVIISHPSFNDKTYLLVPSPKDTAFNFKNVVLPPKSVELNEVEIIAYKEKSYYKGDTLVFTADSFKTGANATVEDLLKKLPGVRVDAKGKITIQGKEVDQVLVDGDEFFGTDPTVATRNLNAASIENVQVYDKKNESAEDGKSETVKVVNLKMKEDAKKGYFGKVSGATDFQKFYENDVLLNKFKGSRKISAFGLLANTPKSAFGWGDANKYGLSGESPYTYDDETGSWTSSSDGKTGIPRTIKAGVYFNDKIGKNTKINTDYTYNQNQLQSGTETNTQFFLPDTSYSNYKTLNNVSKNQNHAFNFRLSQKLDSLTELTVAPKVKYGASENSNLQSDKFISKEDILTRETSISNKNSNQNLDLNVLLKLSKNFMKKDRNVTLSYQPIYSSSNSSAFLNTDFKYYQNQLPDSSLVQKRTQDNLKVEHNASIVYTEPWTKKIKTELSYNFTSNEITNNRKTFDNSGSSYDLFNPFLSNNFDNKRMINRAGTKFIYDVKKYRISVGSYFRNVQQRNVNLSTGTPLSLTVNNILPVASFNYRISQGSNLFVGYTSSSQQPELTQMQPVQDNSDPNRISIGNPNLKPTFSNNVNMNYYFYKGVSDVNFYMGSNAGNTNNQISYTTSYDSLGKAITQPINVNGNYNANLYLGGGFPIFKRFLKVYYNLNSNYSNNVSYVNYSGINTKNTSQNASFGPQLTIEKNSEKFNMSIGGNYEYSIPKSNISVQSNQPYYTYGIEGRISIKLPKKFFISTDGNYTNNGNRTAGYNINYFIWNASFAKTFFKTENFILSINANDILNQNISNQRYISSNQIVDTKTQIIKRYFLLKAVFKFNSQKTKSEEEDDDY